MTNPDEEPLASEKTDEDVELAKETLEDLDAPGTDADEVKGGTRSATCASKCNCRFSADGGC